MARTEHGPSGPRVMPAVELRIAASTARFLAVLALPSLVVGWFAAQRAGLLAAAIAVALVAAMVVLSAVVQAAAARRGPSGVMGGVLAGFAVRLVTYILLLARLDAIPAVDDRTLAAAVAALLVATLGYEAWLVLRDPSFFWIDVEIERNGA